jgi:hypothetical protein
MEGAQVIQKWWELGLHCGKVGGVAHTAPAPKE